MYEEVAAASGKIVPPAEPAPTATYKEMAGAVRGTLLRSQNPDAVGAVVGRKVKTVGLDTILKNSLRDGAQFAWIPSGDTCAFCMMLASNGWQRASKKALKNGHASHVHNNCDCSYAVRFDDNTEVEGYDPDYYKDIYDNAEGDTWEQKTNYLRRKNYAANKDKINAQKRAAYAERKSSRGLSSGRNENGIPDHDPPEFIRELLDYEDRREVLLSYEKSIVDEPVENAIVITTDGKIYRCKGTLNGVYPDTDLGEQLYGAYVTHNHPIGSNNEYSFSDDDIALFRKYNLSTLRGIDELFEYELSLATNSIDQEIFIFDIDEYSFRHNVVICKAKEYGYGYWRRKRKP